MGNDKGINWVLKTSGISSDLYSVDFVDVLTGWAIGKDILNTTDGGNTWKVQKTSIYASYLQRVKFINKNNGFISNGYVTSSGGFDWQKVSVSLADVIMLDANNLLGCYGKVFSKSIDGGLTWNSIVLSDAFYGIYFIDQQKGWIVGDNSIFKTLDGGITWINEVLGDSSSPYSNRVQFTDSNNGWVVGNSGKILKY